MHFMLCIFFFTRYINPLGLRVVFIIQTTNNGKVSSVGKYEWVSKNIRTVNFINFLLTCISLSKLMSKGLCSESTADKIVSTWNISLIRNFALPVFLRERSEIIREGGLQTIGEGSWFFVLWKREGCNFFSCHLGEGHNFLCSNLV